MWERKENWVKVRRQRYSELSWLVYLLDKLVHKVFSLRVLPQLSNPYVITLLRDRAQNQKDS